MHDGLKSTSQLSDWGAGEIFTEHPLGTIQLENKPVNIVVLADPHLDTPIAPGLTQNGVPVYDNFLDIASHGEEVDIIFNLSGGAVATP